MNSEAIALRTRRLYAVMAGTATVPTVVVDIIAHLIHRIEDLEARLNGTGGVDEPLVVIYDGGAGAQLEVKADTGGLNR